MADQASGYLQRKVDEARRNALQEKLRAAREESCCIEKSRSSAAGNAGANSGYLAGLVADMPAVYSQRRGGPASLIALQKIDAMKEWDRVNNLSGANSRRLPIPICTTPPNTIYNAGLPVPVPKFPCVLINNMTTGS